MKSDHLSALVAATFLFLTPSASAASPYVPGMTCEQVGGFAAAVVDAKKLGDSKKQQISDMRQSIGGYRDTQHALAAIISGIYDSPKMRAATAEAVQGAYTKACEVWEGR